MNARATDVVRQTTPAEFITRINQFRDADGGMDRLQDRIRQALADSGEGWMEPAQIADLICKGFRKIAGESFPGESGMNMSAAITAHDPGVVGSWFLRQNRTHPWAEAHPRADGVEFDKAIFTAADVLMTMPLVSHRETTWDFMDFAPKRPAYFGDPLPRDIAEQFLARYQDRLEHRLTPHPRNVSRFAPHNGPAMGSTLDRMEREQVTLESIVNDGGSFFLNNVLASGFGDRYWRDQHLHEDVERRQQGALELVDTAWEFAPADAFRGDASWPGQTHRDNDGYTEMVCVGVPRRTETEGTRTDPFLLRSIGEKGNRLMCDRTTVDSDGELYIRVYQGDHLITSGYLGGRYFAIKAERPWLSHGETEPEDSFILTEEPTREVTLERERDAWKLAYESLATFVGRIGGEYAENNDLCGVYEDCIDAVNGATERHITRTLRDRGLPQITVEPIAKRQREFDVEVEISFTATGTYTTTISVHADNEDDAREMAEEQAQEGLDESDILNAVRYNGNWDVDEVSSAI